MRTLLAVCLFCVPLSACSAKKPVADLAFSHFKKAGDAYEVGFKSNIDLDALYASEKDEKVVSRRLICALDKDRDFSVNHSLQKYLRGEIAPLAQKQPSTYSYLAHADFYKSFDNDTTRQYIDERELAEILSKTPEIACKVVMTVYMKSPYYSATMLIPAGEILKVISPANSK